MKKAAYTIVAVTTLFAAAQAQTSLDSAERTFRAADLNRDGVLTSREAGAASVALEDFRAFDKDSDASMTRDEFVVFYRDLLVRAKQPVSVELTNEADRIAARAKSGTRGGGEQVRSGERTGQAGSGQAGSGQAGNVKPPTARAEAARRQLQRERNAAILAAEKADAAGAPVGLEARVVAALSDFERSMKDGTISLEAFRSMRGTLVEDARRAARVQGDPAVPLTGLEQRLLAALGTLEQRAQDGEAGTAAELKALRDLAIQHAREVDAARKAQQKAEQSPDARAAAARAELRRQQKAAGQGPEQGAAGASAQVANDLMSALDQLERRALASQATPEDYRQVRERLIARARKAARKEGQGSEASRHAQRLLAALDTLQQKADNGRVSQADFSSLREQMIARAREAQVGGEASGTSDASANTPAVGAATPPPAKNSRRLLLALDTLERRVLEGNAAPEEFARLRELFIAKARGAASRGGTPEGGMTPGVARRLQGALDEIQAKTLRGEVKRSDFQAVREMMIGTARKSKAGANGSTGAEASSNAGARRRAAAADATKSGETTQQPEARGDAKQGAGRSQGGDAAQAGDNPSPSASGTGQQRRRGGGDGR